MAALTVPRQTWTMHATQELQERGEVLAFKPWCSLPEHRPLGGMSRARQPVYLAMESFRHLRNATAEATDAMHR